MSRPVRYPPSVLEFVAMAVLQVNWKLNNLCNVLCQSVMEYEEHEKRAWSVDFSRTEPSMLVSGSDDCKVF
jgi:hypothetical protein